MMRERSRVQRVPAGLVLIGLVAGAAAAGASDLGALSAQLEEARRSYDLSRVQEVYASLRGVADEDAAAKHLLLARTALAIAELERLHFESLPARAGQERRLTGDRIDAMARAGLHRLDQLPETSQTARLRADLIGTMIRSKFRGKRYRGDMENAAQRAIELDPTNALAFVSAAKPYLLRPGRDAQDLEKGLQLVGRALKLDPDLEPALLLQGRALWDQGLSEEARAVWNRVLELNPDSQPARDWLAGEGLEEPPEDLP